jgi:hypothetical protein
MSCCGKIVGAAKLVQAELNIGVLDAPRIAERRKACESCDRWDHGRCLECGCYTYAKTKLTHERCPLGKWSAAS